MLAAGLIQGATELGFPRPAPGEMQSEAARRAGDPSHQSEDPGDKGSSGEASEVLTKPGRLRVLVITVRSPRPIRAVQRARLCAITWTASQAPLAAKRPDGMWFSPVGVDSDDQTTTFMTDDSVISTEDCAPARYLRSPAYGVLDLGVAAMIGLQFQRLPIAVGDQGVIAVSGNRAEFEEGELGTGRRLHPPDNEPHRRGVRLGLERGVEPVSKVSNSASVYTVSRRWERRQEYAASRYGPGADVAVAAVS